MSLFLGPVHKWLFNKIVLLEKLEKSVIENSLINFNNDLIISIVQDAELKFGEYLKTYDLEELIDSTNIHGWLQNSINIVEKRSSYIFSNLYLHLGNQFKNILIEEVIKQAIDCSNSNLDISLPIHKNSSLETPKELFNHLNNFILSGMPCDKVNVIELDTDDKFKWKQEKCIHLKNYSESNSDIELMYLIKDLWIKTFIESFDSYKYNVIRDNELSLHEILKYK